MLYTSIGGIKAVTITDMVQFFIFIVAVPLITYHVVYHVGSIEALFTKVPSEKFLILGHERFYRYTIYFMIWLLQIGMVDPAVVQRMLMAKSKLQLCRKYMIVALFDPTFRFLVMLIGLGGLVLYPSIKPNIVVPHIIQELLPAGIKGLAIAGLLAIIMSSADSYIHIAGVTLIHDVISPLCKKRLTTFNECYWVRYTTLLTGFLAIFIALKMIHIPYLGFKALELIAPMLLVPFISAIMGLKANKKAFIASLITSVLIFIFSNSLLPTIYNILSIPITTLSSGFIFFLVHLCTYKRWEVMDRFVNTFIIKFKPTSVGLFQILTKDILNFYTILFYIKHNVQKYGSPYVLSGILCGCNLLIPNFIDQQAITSNQTLLLSLLSSGIIFCFFLIIKDKWPQNIQDKYLSLFFLFTVSYCLPFFNTIMVLATKGNIIWVIQMLLSLIFFISLIDYLNMIWLMPLSIIVGWLIFKGHFGTMQWNIYNNSYYLVGYQFTMSLLVAFNFSYRKRKKIVKLYAQQQQINHTCRLNELDYLHNIQHQLLQEKYFFSPIDYFNCVKNVINNISRQSIQENPYIQKSIEQLDSFTSYYKNQVYSNIDYLRLSVSSIEINQLFTKLAASLKPLGLEEKIQVYIRTKYESIYCDSEQIIQLLLNKLNDLQKESKGFLLTLSLQETTLCYPLHVVTNRNYKKIVPAIGFILSTTQNLVKIKPTYTVDRNILEISIPKDITQLIEYKNQRIIHAHYGYCTTITTESDIQVVYIIPIDLQSIRPKIIDTLSLLEGPLETESSLVLEKYFLSQLEEKTNLDVTFVQNTIQQIKKIHKGQFRKSGELFYTHPLVVATILLKMTNDPDAIIAALLHDTIEDTPFCLYQIAYQYGKEVAYIVDKVTNMDCISSKKIKLTEKENKDKISDYKDIRVVMVKLADRLHNLQTIEFQSFDKQKKIAQETLDFYIPLGEILKIRVVNQVVDEMKTICNNIINQVNTKKEIVI
ncbi:sodium:solute symporter family protein [Cardinium endosymbiont of Bemisia tabaci]|uniref:sodium:solute symporter family protein n=1 Tax=Cardinium endosymbiont of Bemisia tabaci TaxID=672794 RepID=UPI001CB7B03E|nr:sodium:solute symporter family protein [Cardinium endosymbiont of Bemisia tabaci]